MTLPIATPRDTARVTLRLLWKRPWQLVSTIALLLLGATSALWVPLLLGTLVDAVIARQTVAHFWQICAVLLAAGSLAACLQWAGGMLLVHTLQAALSELREGVFGVALSLPLTVVEEAGSGDIVARVTGDVQAVTEAISDVLPRFLQAALTIGLTAVGLSILDPWLALAAVLAVPLQVAATVRFLRRSRPLYTRLRQEEAHRGQVLIEAAAGADTVRAHRSQDSHLERIARASTSAVQTQRQAARARNRFNGGLNAAELVGLAAVLATGFVLTTATGLTIGAVTAAALFFHRLFGPIGALLGSIDDLQRALAGLERLIGVLQTGTSGREQGTPIRDASVRIREVGFRYDTNARRDALSRIDLDIDAGTTAVFVGASGSGKSTMARLIAGLDRPGRGLVHIGGVPAHEARHEGRPAALLVTQEAHLFAGSVADNLRLARPDASDDQLLAALVAVEFDMDSLFDGADTVLGHGASHLHTQQIALARVLLADPPVVVLDEATAQAGTDRRLLAALRTVTRGRTAIIIAHQLTHARGAELVAVFSHGTITESGTMPELLARSEGTFARLWLAEAGSQHVQDDLR
ncbi:ABC transporter ATP-binding protein [Okibacterium endophyticum]